MPPPLPNKKVVVKGVFSEYMGLSPPRVCEIYGFRRVLGPKGTTSHPPERKQTLSTHLDKFLNTPLVVIHGRML